MIHACSCHENIFIDSHRNVSIFRTSTASRMSNFFHSNSCVNATNFLLIIRYDTNYDFARRTLKLEIAILSRPKDD